MLSRNYAIQCSFAYLLALSTIIYFTVDRVQTELSTFRENYGVRFNIVPPNRPEANPFHGSISILALKNCMKPKGLLLRSYQHFPKISVINQGFP